MRGTAKPIKDTAPVIRRNTRAIVANVNLDRALRFTMNLDENRTSIRRVFDGVVDEIQECLTIRWAESRPVFSVQRTEHEILSRGIRNAGEELRSPLFQ